MFDNLLEEKFSEKEYKECRFIDTEMSIIDLDDFKKNKEVIKQLYERLPHKIFYKWYVYANIHMSLIQKDAVWLYLNGDLTDRSLDKH